MLPWWWAFSLNRLEEMEVLSSHSFACSFHRFWSRNTLLSLFRKIDAERASSWAWFPALKPIRRKNIRHAVSQQLTRVGIHKYLPNSWTKRSFATLPTLFLIHYSIVNRRQMEEWWAKLESCNISLCAGIKTIRSEWTSSYVKVNFIGKYKMTKVLDFDHAA